VITVYRTQLHKKPVDITPADVREQIQTILNLAK
jgi:hypothetical protein